VLAEVVRGLRTALAAAITTLFATASLCGAAEAAPPSAGEIERATDRFLTAHARTQAPRAGTGGVGETATGTSLPDERVVAFYGAPQMGATILGSRSPRAAARRLAAQSDPYAELGTRPVAGAFDLVSVFATAGGGSDGLYRTRQDPDVIRIYLDQARAVGARLVLDIQPGRSSFLAEMRALRPWLKQPDVDLALDPEWNVGRRGVPGRTDGKVGATEVNRVKRALAEIVRENSLPPKLLVVHQFRRGSIRDRSRIAPGRDVQVVLNFDGIGSPRAKSAGYAALSVARLFDGFSLFYRRDEPLMKPRAVLGLSPEPDFLLYQ
jgi:hypothetical protein